MKIRSLTLENFRQFHGANVLQFSIGEGQGITVVHGENGAGKTSILNAFKWAFYGVTDFDTGVDNILNEQAISEKSAGDDIKLSVTVEFGDGDKKYTLLREQVFKKAEGMSAAPIGGSVAELTWHGPEGFETSKNPENHINQIFPEKMHSYFFFNGERIEKLANASSKHQIRDAIKTLMGLEIVERAESHLRGQVAKHFRNSMKGSSESKLDELLDQQSDLVDKLDALNGELETADDTIVELSVEVEEISRRLGVIKEAAELQKERDQTEARIADIADTVNEINSRVAGEISKNGFLAFFEDVSISVGDLLEERRQKGELPYKIKGQFIDDLLEAGKCICGQPLNHGEKPFEAVAAYRESASHQGIEEAFIQTAGGLKLIPNARETLFKDLKFLSSDKTKLLEEREKLNGRLDEISNELNDSDIEDIEKLESRRRLLEKERSEKLEHKGELKGKIKRLKEEQAVLDEQVDEHSAKSDTAKKGKKKIEIAEECARVLAEIREALANQTREKLSKQVNETFQSIVRKNYWAEIDEDYCLQIYKDIPGHGSQLVVEKSTGENQITSLSFIASIVEMAKSKKDDGSQFFKGGIYPIVMDSPFGALDPEYRELVARHIPALADQLILLASSSQWKGEVEKECKPRVGKELSLIYHSPNVTPDEESPYKKKAEKHEFTTIEEGYHG